MLDADESLGSSVSAEFKCTGKSGEYQHFLCRETFIVYFDIGDRLVLNGKHIICTEASDMGSVIGTNHSVLGVDFTLSY